THLAQGYISGSCDELLRLRVECLLVYAWAIVCVSDSCSGAGNTSCCLCPYQIVTQKALMIGLLHVCAHLSAALILMLLLELGVELCIRHKLLATSGYHTLYEWYRQVEGEHFPDPTGLRARLEQWTFGLYPACIKYLMSAFDIPEDPLATVRIVDEFVIRWAENTKSQNNGPASS
ncbi:hypothetical protein AKJ16_DCAP07546, partial [Drosera capensis]